MPHNPDPSVFITCNAEPLLAVFRQAKADIEAGHLSKEILQGFFRLIDFPSELIRFESESAPGALRITLQPSDRLLEFLATARAHQFDFHSIERSGHHATKPDTGGSECTG